MKLSTRSDMLANEEIGKLLWRLSLPAVIGMMVQALYNIVDTIFVGRWAGALGISALTVVLPIQMLMMAVGQTIGMGGASIISRRMGAGDRTSAARTLGNMFSLSIALGLLISIPGLILIVPLLQLFGVTGEALPLSISYLQVILFACPIIIFSQAANNALRAEGNAKTAMKTMLIGTVINLILDPVFIFGLKWGVRGAAWATLVSLTISSLAMAFYYIRGRSEVDFGWHFLRPDKAIIKEIFAIGASGFAHGGAMSLTTSLIVNTLSSYGGALAIATFGVMFRMMTFIFMPLMGLTQGLQPIVGFNFGAGQYRRVRSSIKLAAVVAVMISTLGFLVIALFPGVILKLFADDPALVASGRNALRLSMAALPLAGFQIVGSGLFQSLGKALQALLLTLSRQVLVFIPTILIMPRLFGVNGVWMTFPVSDMIAFAITSLFVYRVFKIIPKS